jgi:hypothetical protein
MIKKERTLHQELENKLHNSPMVENHYLRSYPLLFCALYDIDVINTEFELYL